MTGADLEKLLADATPGPWAYEAHGDTGEYGVGLCFADDDHDCERPLQWQVESDATVEDPVAVEVLGQANARLIALAPTLASRVIAAEKLAEALREVKRLWAIGTEGRDLSWRVTFEQAMDQNADALAAWDAAQQTP